MQELILTRLDSTKNMRVNAQVMQTQNGRWWNSHRRISLGDKTSLVPHPPFIYLSTVFILTFILSPVSSTLLIVPVGNTLWITLLIPKVVSCKKTQQNSTTYLPQIWGLDPSICILPLSNLQLLALKSLELGNNSLWIPFKHVKNYHIAYSNQKLLDPISFNVWLLGHIYLYSQTWMVGML